MKKQTITLVLTVLLIGVAVSIGLANPLTKTQEEFVVSFASVENEYCSYADGENFVPVRVLTQEQVNRITSLNWDMNYSLDFQDVYYDRGVHVFKAQRSFNDVRLIDGVYYGGRNFYSCEITEEKFMICMNTFERQGCKDEIRTRHSNYVSQVEQELKTRIGGYQT